MNQLSLQNTRLEQHNNRVLQLQQQLETEEKRTKSAKAERDRFKELRDEIDEKLKLVELELSEVKDSKQVLRKELHFYKEKYEEFKQAKTDLVAQNKQLEAKVSELQADLVKNNKISSERWDKLQEKYSTTLSENHKFADLIHNLKSELEMIQKSSSLSEIQLQKEWTKSLNQKDSEINKHTLGIFNI